MILREGTTVKINEFFGDSGDFVFFPTLEPPLKTTSCLSPQKNSGFFQGAEDGEAHCINSNANGMYDIFL